MKSKSKILIRFLATTGSIGNAVIAYHFWLQVSPLWAWLWLILGCFAIAICIFDNKEGTTNAKSN
jgi:peptidoglycan/LPS O-acetylase OafA/YrhL